MAIVHLTDEGLPDSGAGKILFMMADSWATMSCESYVGYEINDISDHSLVADEVASYQFKDEKDAVLFRLKWK